VATELFRADRLITYMVIFRNYFTKVSKNIETEMRIWTSLETKIT